MIPQAGHRQRGFVNTAFHYGREFGRRAGLFLRAAGPTINNIAMVAAPALLSAGNPGDASVAATLGQAADNYSQLRSQIGHNMII